MRNEVDYDVKTRARYPPIAGQNVFHEMSFRVDQGDDLWTFVDWSS